MQSHGDDDLLDPLSAPQVLSSDAHAASESLLARTRALALGIDMSQEATARGSNPADVPALLAVDGRPGILHDAIFAAPGSRAAASQVATVAADAKALLRVRHVARVVRYRAARGARERVLRDSLKETSLKGFATRSRSAGPAPRRSSADGAPIARDASVPPPSKRRVGALGGDGDLHEADVAAATARSIVSAALEADASANDGVARIVGTLTSTTPRLLRAATKEIQEAVTSVLASNPAAYDKVLARRMQAEARAVSRAASTRAILRSLGLDEAGVPVDPRTLMDSDELAADDKRLAIAALENQKSGSRTKTGFRKDKLAQMIRHATSTIHDYDVSLRAIDAYDELLAGGVLYQAHAGKVSMLAKQRRAIAEKLGIDWLDAIDAKDGKAGGAEAGGSNVAAPPPDPDSSAAGILSTLAARGPQSATERLALAKAAIFAKEIAAADASAVLKAASDRVAAGANEERPGSHAVTAMFERARAAVEAKRALRAAAAERAEFEVVAADLALLGNVGGAADVPAAQKSLTEAHPTLAALTFGGGSVVSGAEGNPFALAMDRFGQYDLNRDSTHFKRFDPYSFETVVQGAPSSGIRRLVPAFGSGLNFDLYKHDPYQRGTVVRGSAFFDPDTPAEKAQRKIGEKPPDHVRVMLPAPNELTGVNLEPTHRGKEPPAAESLTERRFLHEKRLITAEADVKKYRFVGGVRFIDSANEEKQLVDELVQLRDNRSLGSEAAAPAAGDEGAPEKPRAPLAALRAFSDAATEEGGMNAQRKSVRSEASASAGAPPSTSLILPPRHDEEADDVRLMDAGLPDDAIIDSSSSSLAANAASGDFDVSARLNELSESLNIAVIRRTNPFKAPEANSFAAMQSREAQSGVLLDPNDRGFLKATSRWKPATLMRGYTSGNVADYLRLMSIFAPFAEAEWMTRGGAYLERRAIATEFVRAVRRRMQGRDPITGFLEVNLFGSVPPVPGQPKPGDPDFRERWDPALIPSIRRYYIGCMRDGVPPVLGDLPPAARASRDALAKVAMRYKAELGPRTLRATNEQWDAYCKLYAYDPKDIARRVIEANELAAPAAKKKEETDLALLTRQMKRKERLMEERRAEIEGNKRKEADTLAAAVKEKAAALEEAAARRAVAMGLDPHAMKSRRGRIMVTAGEATKTTKSLEF